MHAPGTAKSRKSLTCTFPITIHSSAPKRKRSVITELAAASAVSSKPIPPHVFRLEATGSKHIQGSVTSCRWARISTSRSDCLLASYTCFHFADSTYDDSAKDNDSGRAGFRGIVKDEEAFNIPGDLHPDESGEGEGSTDDWVHLACAPIPLATGARDANGAIAREHGSLEAAVLASDHAAPRRVGGVDVVEPKADSVAAPGVCEEVGKRGADVCREPAQEAHDVVPNISSPPPSGKRLRSGGRRRGRRDWGGLSPIGRLALVKEAAATAAAERIIAVKAEILRIQVIRQMN